jgi:hypothetical protein
VELGFVSSTSSLSCLQLTPKSLLKNSAHINRWSRKLKIVDTQKRISYSKRRFGGWQKRRRNGNKRRRRIRDGRRTRGKGGLRWWRRSTQDRRSWRTQDRVKGRLWNQRTAEKRWKRSRKAQTKK